jgi:hypothetical protein
MADLLREYTTLIGGTGVSAYVAQAWGRKRSVPLRIGSSVA